MQNRLKRQTYLQTLLTRCLEWKTKFMVIEKTHYIVKILYTILWLPGNLKKSYELSKLLD